MPACRYHKTIALRVAVAAFGFSAVMILQLEKNSADAFVPPSLLSLHGGKKAKTTQRWMTTGNDAGNEDTAHGYSDLGKSLSDQDTAKANAFDDDFFLQLQMEEAQQRRRRQLQSLLLSQDPLLDQEARNGRVELPDFKVETNKDRLTVFSGNDKIDSYLQSPSRSKPRRSADLPGLSSLPREASTSYDLNLSGDGEALNEEKKLVRPQNFDAILGTDNYPTEEVTYSEQSAETSSTEDLLARLQNRQNGAIYEPAMRAEDSQVTENSNTIPPQEVNERVSDEAMQYIQAQTMGAGTRGVARENDSTSLDVYPRNQNGEPVVEQKHLVMPSSDAATVAASVLGDTSAEAPTTTNYDAYSSNTIEKSAPDDAKLTMTQKDTQPKHASQQFLATTPNAGMAEILDMDRSKAYSLSSNARMAASILSKSDDHEDQSGSEVVSERMNSKHFSMVPSNAFPALQAKSRPVMARSRTADTAARVLMTGVREDEKDQDESLPVDKKTFFFRPDQDEVPVVKKQAAVSVDNPFEYKQTLSEPEQRPALARRAHLYAASMSLSGGHEMRGLSPGMVDGPPSQGQKVFAQSVQSVPQEKRGLSPGVVSQNVPSREMVFARAFIEPTDKASRGLAPGLVPVDQPFHYKQAVSKPEHNPASAQQTMSPKKRYVINPGLLSDSSAPRSRPSVAGLDQPFQYKQVQSVPNEFENPAGIRHPVPVESMIPDSIADAPPSDSGLLTPDGVQNVPEEDVNEDAYSTIATTQRDLHKDWEEIPQPNLVTPLDGSMATGSGGPSPEDATVGVETGVLPVPVRQENKATIQPPVVPLQSSPVNPNDITSQSHVGRPWKELMAPTDSSMARAHTGVSPEDATVRIQSDVLSVPIRKNNSPAPQQHQAPSQTSPVVNPNDITNHNRVDRPTKELRAPTGSSMARAYKGITPEDAAHISSGVLSVPVPENIGAASQGKEQESPAQPSPSNPNDITRENLVGRPEKKLVPHTDSSMAKAYAEIEDYVHVKSGVMSVPIRKISGTGPSAPTPTQQNEEVSPADPVNPNDITSETHVDKPKKTLVAPTASSMARVDMAGPGDRPLPNPSGIISFPDTSPKTTAPPGVAQSSAMGLPRVTNPNEITGQNVVGRPKKKLVAHASGSMAKAREGPYTALPGEEPVSVTSNILSVPIRNLPDKHGTESPDNDVDPTFEEKDLEVSPTDD
ncbi:MAG: hypothetical protein SGILL_003076 [Bacillariaceae sp.]